MNMRKKWVVQMDEMWEKLERLQEEYAEACVALSSKGGGDPIDEPVIVAEHAAAEARLKAHILMMRREFE